MNSPTTATSNNAPLLIAAAVILIGIILVISAFRFFARMSRPLEMLLMVFESMGGFFGGRRVVLVGCTVIGLIVLGCILASILTVLAVSTCGTAHPVQLCRWFGS